MTIRTFKQAGIAFGNQPLNITAKIDNVVVYQGPVVTLNESFPDLPNLDYDVTNTLFSWTADVDFSGPQTIEITVDEGADLLVASISANYTPISYTVDGNVVVYTGSDKYSDFPWEIFGDTYINGVLQSSQVIDHSTLGGQWWWRLPPGSVFVENITIPAGAE